MDRCDTGVMEYCAHPCKYSVDPILHESAGTLTTLSAKINITLKDIPQGYTPMSRRSFIRAITNGKSVSLSRESLFRAITNGRPLKEITEILDCKTHLVSKALPLAIINKREDIVVLLLSRGAHINQVDSEYRTPLSIAVGLGFERMVLLLLDREANINKACVKTALTVAAGNGAEKTVSLLLDRGADINAVCEKNGQTALGMAVVKGSKDVVSMLVDRGADMNLVTSEFGTVLGQAVYIGKTEIVSILLEGGADVMHVGGSYSTASGVYPNALDVAHSEGSRADTKLLELLESAVHKDFNIVDHVISRPPFPMPYTRQYSALHAVHNKCALPSSFDILSTTFDAGGNITPEQANVPCREINEESLCRSLAALVGLNKDATQAKGQWIRSDVRYFVACNLDFGLAYAAARVAWKRFNEHSVDSKAISIHRCRWHRNAQELDKARSKAIEIDHSTFLKAVTTDDSNAPQQLIISPYSIMPRRIWDLKSNRVVDFRMLHAAQPTIVKAPTFWAVTHSWTMDMSPIETAVNQHQWPVPIPRDISLDYLRSELLALGAEYVWIDVVCLRQRSEVDFLERLRQEEWKLDVPTIGNIYRAAAHIVRYFNGLGIRFNNNGWDDKRHWLQRAWTLQEIATESNTINAGISRDEGQIFLNSEGTVLGRDVKLRSAIRPVIQLAAHVDSEIGCEVYELVREMSKRHAREEIDKLSGLFYLLHTTKLPCYDAHMSSEDFWRRCFHLLPVERKTEILFDFPYRGSYSGSGERWSPTWAQLLAWPERDPEYDHTRLNLSSDFKIRIIAGERLFISKIWVIPDATFYGTAKLSEYKVKINNRKFGFYLPYLSQNPIDVQGEPKFTLATAGLGHPYNWVVCEAVETRVGEDIGLDGVRAEVHVLKKVGVVRTDTCGELLVGGENGMSLLQEIGCLFV